ncbi:MULTISPECIES: hypothetical protein [unclassified Neorhizobium]|uniref:hypothetical protein n=1 Tax=unclassified Neorhizobium TaxID=2629175 RepID=UPI001FF47B9F|nr:MULTISPECIES: hypothetical protein [unclassified Neorhizobium]MCJ9668528.1 hypothetical protein [Neorhizobium sp. SHOUNA12B]MCJ9744231.1 hypothetical protein [Neorhizobium sp. SHOUNA12A]
MQNTVKVATFLWFLLALIMVLVLLVLSASLMVRVPLLWLWGIALLAIAYPAYRSYRRGTPVGTERTFKARLASRLSAFGIVLVLAVMVYDVANVQM